MIKMKLFCLPNAGGSANMTYMPWKRHLPSTVSVIPIEPAGHGPRMIEPLVDTMEEVMADLYAQVRPHLDGTPYAIFGHSMGSLLTYELSHKLIEAGHQAPVSLFVSGRKPPHHPSVKVGYNLPREGLKQFITELGGTSADILNNDTFFDMVEPLIRADLTLVDTYEYREKNRVLDCPIVVLNGLSDPLTTVEHMEEWKHYTTGEFAIHHYEGGHFFLHNDVEDICAKIANAV